MLLLLLFIEPQRFRERRRGKLHNYGMRRGTYAFKEIAHCFKKITSFRRQSPAVLLLLFVCVQACGSGGTAAGLALGCHLSGLKARMHAYGVCDDPEYFYTYIDELYKGLGWTGAFSYADAQASAWSHIGYSGTRPNGFGMPEVGFRDQFKPVQE